MNMIRLMRLTLDQFKGQEHLDLDLRGESAGIYGNNSAGKTTVYDAVTWLLFGKDSHGQSSFDIKPLDGDGAVKDHTAISAVEAVFSSADGNITLKKTYYERWSTKRGGTEEVYDGNTSDYFVDGVPSKKYEYERRVSELVSEDVFRLLTGVTYFCAEMDWRERRNVLFDVCGIATDLEMMEQDPQFSPLVDALGHLSLDDYKKKIQAERKGLAGIRDDLPARLDECRKTVEDLQGIDFAALRHERDIRILQKDRLSAELLKLDHSSLLDAKRNEHGSLSNQLAKLENENAAHRRSQMLPPADDGSGLRHEIESLKRSILRWTDEKSRADQERTRCNEAVQLCRVHWGEVNARLFDSAACPTCGQALTGKLLEDARKKAQLEQSTELGDIVADSNRYKAMSEQAELRSEAMIQESVDAENRIAALADKLSALKIVEQPELKNLPDYEQNAAGLSERLAALSGEITALQGETASIQAETRRKIAALSDEITAIEGSIANEHLLTYTVKRMEALRADAQTAAEQIGQLDKTLNLCEEFTRYKVRFVEESINGCFKLARFRLFTQQVNGGLADCCEVLYGGVPYNSNLNSGARVNVGIDVISTLSAHYGVSVPLFVDNAESVTELQPLDTQVIRLVVSQKDLKLRCEHEN